MGNTNSSSHESFSNNKSNEQVSSSSTDETVKPSAYPRMVQNVRLVWLDRAIDEENNRDCQTSIIQLRRVITNINTFTDVNHCLTFLSEIKDEKVCLIISGSFGREIVPCIHDMSEIDSIFIFCGNTTLHKEWAKDWAKIRGVFNDILPICNALKEATKQCEQDAIPMSFMSINTDDTTTNRNLDKLDPTFMYTQILKEILLTIKFKQDHFNDFITFCHNVLAAKGNKLHEIDRFEREYRDKTPIWWYTYDCFLYSTLNYALRKMEMDTLINMGFFVVDLHRQIERLHKKQFRRAHSRQSFIVYRGQGLSQELFKKMQETSGGGLLSFNNFLSTSKLRDVSEPFARRALSNKTSVGVLFVMTIDPSISSTPFASINDVSFYEYKEDEVLFSMHTVFRINEITPMDKSPRLFQIQLTLTRDNDKDLRLLTDHIREETYPNDKGWHRLGLLLFKVGESAKAEQVYKILLEQTENNHGEYNESITFYEKAVETLKKTFLPKNLGLASCYNNIGLAYYNMGDYSKALLYYEKDLEISKQSLSTNHPNLGISYNNIGLVYVSMGDYPKALSYYEKAFEVQKQSLTSNHPDFGMSHNNIGLMYYNMGDYLKALPYYEKALEIRKQSLPSNHPDLGISYNNIGLVYSDMGNYSQALLCYEKAFEIQQQSLPSDHPDMGMSYNNIGLVYNKMGDYPKALSYYEKALEIRKQSLSANHHSLGMSYNNIGSVYVSMGDYPKARSFYERALKIGQHSLPSNHPHLQLFIKNLDDLKKKM